ncbi:MAG: hypothetical protein ABJA79_05485, partial [Parafilimonas sp.]
MLRFASIILLIAFSISSLQAAAQQSNLRKKIISTTGTTQIDSLSIVPNTLIIPGIDTSYYTTDFINATITWKNKPASDSAEIIYRVFSLRLNAIVTRYKYDSIKNNFIVAPEYTKPQSTGNDNAFLNFGKLTYNGSFGRSLSFGNNQDAVFNSQLNLQLNGYIGDSIELNAAITDNNIPIQPEGTTQQLNEFDKVLLQFKKKTWEINLGDIDLRQERSYFLKFYKRLQGISYQQQFNISKSINDNFLISGAIAKGKFARNIFEGQEGNQGPYRLQGNNNELFFIVLAGTEKVFLNGVQVQRGEDQDYVINYNTAEIVFTPRQLITKDTRIQVEFEYADRSFLNTMLYVTNQTNFGKRFTLNVSAYNNADAKNSPINQTLDNPQKQFLSAIGDSIQNAFYPVASIDSFSVDKILYKKIDTLYDGTHDSIYVYSTNPDSTKYSLSFIEVGANKGNYIPLLNAANGKVFQWVQPVSGIPQGSFEAAAFLVTPKKQQVISIGGIYQLDNKTSIQTEFAFSNYDVNTFSPKDKANDKGYAARVFIQRNDSLRTKNKILQLNTIAGYEWVDKNFQPVERLRPVEFARDWGLPLLLQPATELLPSLTLHLSDEKNNNMLYRFSSYIRSDGFKGIRNEIYHQHVLNGFNINDAFSLTNSTTPTDKGFYLRPTIDVNKTFSSLHNYTLGATYSLEHNETKYNLTDTVTPFSFAFETITAYIRSDAAKNNHWAFTYFTREDKIPYQKNLEEIDRSHNYNFQAELLQNPHHQLRLTATYRQLYITNQKLTTQLPDNSLVGRAEYLVNEWNGFVTGNVLYEIGSGQEQRRDFSYIEVPAGTGQYAWIDYNNDGIPQLNEFELAVFPDQAKFVRIYTPTNDYIKASYIQFNYSVAITPKALTAQMKNIKLKNFISKFVLQSSAQTFKKQIAKGNPLYIPFKGNITDTSLITLNYILSNTLSYNRYSTTWGLDLTNVTSYNKTLLTYGLETRQQNEWTLKARVNFAKAYTFELVQKAATNNLYTPSFGNRNYALTEYGALP